MDIKWSHQGVQQQRTIYFHSSFTKLMTARFNTDITFLQSLQHHKSIKAEQDQNQFHLRSSQLDSRVIEPLPSVDLSQTFLSFFFNDVISKPSWTEVTLHGASTLQQSSKVLRVIRCYPVCLLKLTMLWHRHSDRVWTLCNKTAISGWLDSVGLNCLFIQGGRMKILFSEAEI